MKIDSIKAIVVKLDVADEQALFILLAEDGLVNRLGSGAATDADRHLYIGRTNDPLFNELRGKIQPEWMSRLGAYDVPDKAGQVCTLAIAFQDAEENGAGLKFCYGSESQGPPNDIRQFVIDAVELTDPWHDKMKRMAKPKKAKPWWRFW